MGKVGGKKRDEITEQNLFGTLFFLSVTCLAIIRVR